VDNLSFLLQAKSLTPQSDGSFELVLTLTPQSETRRAVEARQQTIPAPSGGSGCPPDEGQEVPRAS
jgi:hypothetical protein